MTVADASSFSIRNALVGEAAPVYVIAEAGVNHDGCASVARELIHAAAEAGADAVKFQVFAASRLVTRTAPAAAYQQRAVHTDSQYGMLSALELTHDTFVELADCAKQRGIEFLATPFSVADLQFLVRIGVSAIKIASPDIVNTPLLGAAARSRLPVIASTGAAELEEIAEAVSFFRTAGGGPLALLHCISSYPTPEREANLRAIGTLARSFGCVAGFSDHTESVLIGGYAVAAGARIIEKHMTLDRSRTGPDHAFSLEPAAMAEYIRTIRHAESLLGDGDVTVSPRQREVRRLSRGSVVAARAIRAGETLTADMLTVKRPGTGIRPAELDTLIGRRAVRDIEADTQLAWDAVEAPVAAGTGA